MPAKYLHFCKYFFHLLRLEYNLHHETHILKVAFEFLLACSLPSIFIIMYVVNKASVHILSEWMVENRDLQFFPVQFNNGSV